MAVRGFEIPPDRKVFRSQLICDLSSELSIFYDNREINFGLK
jgi:hypothetical protein